MSSAAQVTWTSLSDDVTLSQNDQIQIELDVDCSFFSPLSQSDVSAAVAAQPNVFSVLGVNNGCAWYDLSLMCSKILVVVNPQQGVSAGDIRNDANTAISSINSQKLVPCSGFSVGAISRSAPGSIFNPTTTQTISLVALAIIAVVVVFLVIQVKEAV